MQLSECFNTSIITLKKTAGERKKHLKNGQAKDNMRLRMSHINTEKNCPKSSMGFRLVSPKERKSEWLEELAVVNQL